MFNFQEMFGKLKEMQAEMEKTRERLDDLIVDAEAGGGMVRVKANGNRKVLNIDIDNDLLEMNDKEMLEDLVTAAVNKALEKAEQTAREEVAKASQGIVPPGFDLNNLGGM